MKQFSCVVIIFINCLYLLSAQPSVVTEELWSRPASNEWYPFHISLSPDGKYASYLSDKGHYCHIVDIKTSKRIRTVRDTIISAFGTFDAMFTKMVFSPNSRFMACQLNVNGTRFKIMSCETGGILRTFIPDNPAQNLDILAFSPDGSRIVFEGDSTIYEWDWNTGTLSHKFDHILSHWAYIGDYSSDGKYLVATDKKENVTVIRMDDGKVVCSFKPFPNEKGTEIIDITFSADGQTLIILGSGKYIFSYWDAMKGEFNRGVSNPGFFCGKISANRKTVVTNNYDNMVWDAEKGVLLKTFPVYNDLPINNNRFASTLDINEEGTLAIMYTGYSGSSASEVEIYDMEIGKLLTELTGIKTTYLSFNKQISVDDTKIIGVGASKFKELDINTGRTLYRFDNVPFSSFSSVAHSMVSPAIVGSIEDTIYLYDTITQLPVSIGVPGKYIDGVEWSNNGKYIAFRYHDLEVTDHDNYHPGIGVIDTKTKQIVKMKDLTKLIPTSWSGVSVIEDISISPTSDQMIIMSGIYAIVTLPDLRLIEYDNPDISVSAIRFAPDSTLLLAGSEGWMRLKKTQKTWNTIDEFRTPPYPYVPTGYDFCRPYAISPDTRYFAVGSMGWDNSRIDSLIIVWDIINKKEIARFHSGIPHAYLAFSPNNKRLVSLEYDGTICVWDIEQATTEVEESAPLPSTPFTLNVLPNPATDHITIQCPTNGVVTMRDVFGRAVIEEIVVSNGKATISTIDFQSGQYFVEYTDNKGMVTVNKVLIYK
ncbi:MAG: T9SS type A sorting domain-containing protein [Candidatus Kapaibacterium sp.]